MAGGVNKVILVGNLGADPDVRSLENGAQVASFSIATSETYKDRNGEKQTITDWHNVVAWRGLAEISERFLKKGSKVYIEGKLKTRSWQDKEGNTRYTTEVLCDNLVLLDRREDGSSRPGPSMPPEVEMTPANRASSKVESSMVKEPEGQSQEDDLPF